MGNSVHRHRWTRAGTGMGKQQHMQAHACHHTHMNGVNDSGHRCRWTTVCVGMDRWTTAHTSTGKQQHMWVHAHHYTCMSRVNDGRHGHRWTTVCTGTDKQWQAWAQAGANDDACRRMAATTPILAVPSAVLDTPTCHAYVLLILPSNNFIQTKTSWVNKNQKVAKEMSMVLGTSTWYSGSPTWICVGFSHWVTWIWELTYSQVFPQVYL